MTRSRPTLTDPRGALIILLAILVGFAAGGLTYFAHQSLPDSVLAGGGAFGATLLLANTLISP